MSRDVRPPVQMRLGIRGFSRVSTGDSDMPLSCEMKNEPAFNPFQGNPGFFRVRISRGPFPLRHKIQGPSHILIVQEIVFYRCLWKVGLPLQ